MFQLFHLSKLESMCVYPTNGNGAADEDLNTDLKDGLRKDGSANNCENKLTVRQMAKSAASLRRPHLLCKWNKPRSFV